MAQAAERPIAVLFSLFADWCCANGHTDLNRREDCPSFEIEDWKFTLNPSGDGRVQDGLTIPRFSLLVMSPQGWPGVCDPFGGAMMVGMEDDAIAVLERALGSADVSVNPARASAHRGTEWEG